MCYKTSTLWIRYHALCLSKMYTQPLCTIFATSCESVTITQNILKMTNFKNKELISGCQRTEAGLGVGGRWA